MGSDFARHPIVIAMGRLIHDRAKTPAVKGRRVPARLHAFNNENIFFKDLFPLPGIHRAVCRLSLFGRLVQMDMFNSFIMGFRFKYDGKGVITLHPQKHIGVNGNIFRARVPFLG